MKNYRNIQKTEKDIYFTERFVEGEWIVYIANKEDIYFDERDSFFEYAETLINVPIFVDMSSISSQLELDLIDIPEFITKVEAEAFNKFKNLFAKKKELDAEKEIEIELETWSTKKETKLLNKSKTYSDAKKLYKKNSKDLAKLKTKEELLVYYRGVFQDNWAIYE